MEENIELNKIEESKDPTQPEQEIQQKEVERDPVAPKSAGTPTGNIIQFRKGTKAAYSSSSNIDPNTISVVSNADGTDVFSEIFLGDDMIGCGHLFSNYVAASGGNAAVDGRAGLVPAPGSGDSGKFLSVDGWATIPSATIGSLTISDSSQTVPVNPEPFSGSITLHKVAKTGKFDDLSKSFVSKAIIIDTPTGAVTAGWRRICVIHRGSYILFTNGTWSSGKPIWCSVSITLDGTGCRIKQLSGPPGTTVSGINVTKVRAVNSNGSSNTDSWYLDYYHEAQSASPGARRFFIIGSGSVTSVATSFDLVTQQDVPEGTTSTSLTFRIMYDQPSIITNLGTTGDSATKYMNGVNIEPGVKGTLGIANGGTGETTAAGIIQNLIQGALVDATTGDVTDSTELITTYQSGYSSSHKDLYRRNATKLWNYISSKLGSVFGLTSSTDSSDNPITLARTAPAGTSTTQIATTEFVHNAISDLATDSNVVHLTGPETITGEKTFEGAEVLLKNSGAGSNINSGLQLIGNQRQVGSNPAMYSYLPKIKFISGIDNTHTYRGDNFNIWYGTNRWISEDRGESTLYFTYDEVGGSSYTILTLTKDVRTVSSVLTKKYTATFGSSANYGDVTVESPKFKIRTTDTLSGYEYIKADGTGYGGLFGAASSTDPGSAGLVPAPAAGDQVKFLKGNGTWASISISDTKVDQVGINTSTDRYPLILKNKEDTQDENGGVKFSTVGSSLPVLSASPDGKIFAAGVTIVNGSTGLVPTYSNNEYVRADGYGAGGNFTGADIRNEIDGTSGLVPAPIWKEAESYLRGDGTWHDVLSDVAGMIPTLDHKVKMVATATETTKYPLLFKYTGGASYTTDETHYVKFSKVAGNGASILSATPAGDLYAGSLNIKGNASTPTNEIVLESYNASSPTPKLRFQRGANNDTTLDWTISSDADLMFASDYTASGASTPTRKSVLTLRDRDEYHSAQFGSGISVIVTGDAATPTNELILKNYQNGNQTPAIRFQRKDAHDAYIDWLIRDSSTGTLTITSEIKENNVETVTNVIELANYGSSKYAMFGTDIKVISQNSFYLGTGTNDTPLCEWESFSS